MRAVILAGGKGTRLRPYTTLIPKPLVPLGGKYSILEIIVMQLVKCGFNHITLAVNHLSNLIQAYIGDGSKYGVKIDYSLETSELSTIGPLTLIEDLPDSFLVMNGDILCNLNYYEFLDFHMQTSAEITVSSFRRDVKIDFGVLEVDENGKLEQFNEKPTNSYNVSMGIYCINRSRLNQIPKGTKYGFDDLMLDSIANRTQVSVKQFDGFWLDIGRPEDYEYADQNYKEVSKKLGV